MCVNPFKAILGSAGHSANKVISQTVNPVQQVSAPLPVTQAGSAEEQALARQQQELSDFSRLGSRRLRIDLNTNTGGSGLRIPQ